MSQILTSASLPIILIITGAIISVLGTSLAMHQQTKAEQALRERTEEISGVVTSGDSFPSAVVTNPRGDKNVLDLMIMNEGKYPLYDVQVRIVDVIAMQRTIEENKKAGRPAITTADTQKYEQLIKFGTIGPSKAITNLSPLANLNPGDKEFYFNLFFYHRYGQTMQSIRGQRRDNGSWARYNKISKGDEVLKASIDADFVEGE